MSSRTNPRILVGCPTHELKSDSLRPFLNGINQLTYNNFDVLIEDNSPTNAYASRIREEVHDWAEKNPGKKFEVIHTDNPSNIGKQRVVEGRNVIRERVLRGNYDYFLSLEQDLVPPRDVIEVLLSREKDIVSATYLNRKNIAGGYRIEIMAGKYFNDDEKSKGIFRDVGFNDILPSRLQEVDYVGMGCVLISRNILEQIPFRYSSNTPHFDDMLFCMDAQKNGHRVWLDSYTWCLHLFNDAFKKADY